MKQISMLYKMETKRTNQNNNQNNNSKKENSIISEHVMKKFFETVHSNILRDKYTIIISHFFQKANLHKEIEDKC